MLGFTNTHTKISELLEDVFSVRPVLRPYNKNQLSLPVISRVEARSNTSTVALRVVGDDEKVSL
jgi:hypothetical protein